MNEEISDQVALEKERMKYTVLAGNVHLWQQLYGEENEISDEEIEWIKPESAEDIEAILSVLSATQTDGERSLMEQESS